MKGSNLITAYWLSKKSMLFVVNKTVATTKLSIIKDPESFKKADTIDIPLIF